MNALPRFLDCGFAHGQAAETVPIFSRSCTIRPQKKAGQPPARFRIRYNAHGFLCAGGSPIFCSGVVRIFGIAGKACVRKLNE